MEGITSATGLLEKLMHAAERKFPLAVSITAGYDTRLILAATREISERLDYYSMMFYKLTPQSSDVDIPHKLLTSMGLDHRILDCTGEMDEGFREIYMQNVDLAHEAWGHIACGLYHSYPQDLVSVKGVCGEIGRMTSSRFGYLEKLDGETLAELFFMGASPFAVQAFDDWSRESLETITANEYRALDIFYWEHKMGSWQAVSQLEWDIVQETFSPFNCRELLEIILSVDEKYRRKPKERLMRAMMAELWPVVLTQPLNPRPLKIKLRKRFRLVWRSERFKWLRDTFRRLRHGGQYG
jgi:hypothetical protein